MDDLPLADFSRELLVSVMRALSTRFSFVGVYRVELIVGSENWMDDKLRNSDANVEYKLGDQTFSVTLRK